MSGGRKCRCEESVKPLLKRNWSVTQYKYNQSAFNGYKYTPSDWSGLRCNRCKAQWRSRAEYVDKLFFRERQLDGKRPSGGMMELSMKELEEMIESHKGWLEGRGQALTLVNEDFSGVKLSGLDLRGAYLDGVNLHRADLSGSDLSLTCMRECDFSEADLSGAIFREALLIGSDFNGADLNGADFSGAVLWRAVLSGANFLDADLYNADIRDAIFFGMKLSEMEGETNE